jgi:hypothetical protein
MSKELTPIGELFERMAAVFYGQDTFEYEKIMKDFKEIEKNYIRKKERDTAEDVFTMLGDYSTTTSDIETFLNENYPL